MGLRADRFWLGLAAWVLGGIGCLAAPSPAYGEIEVLRDQWGVPHVFSGTDVGAMYGLGYLTARERGFQMTYSLRIIFAGDGTRDLLAWRGRVTPRAGQPQPRKPAESWLDDAAAVVQRGDVASDWLRRTEAFCSSHGLGESSAAGDAPKFSHAWVVGGRRTTTGAAVLVSDPQTPVRNPSLWMEFHVSGQTFNARGIGVPGSPGLLIGFNRRIAWGLTALGADQADLFRLETSPDHPDDYRWDGVWRRMEVRKEKIEVNGGNAVTIAVRETHLGPVVSAFCFRQPGDPEVALKRVPLCEANRDTIQAVFGMMRARSAVEFARALGGVALSQRALRVRRRRGSHRLRGAGGDPSAFEVGGGPERPCAPGGCASD